MKKLTTLSLITAAVIGLTGCGGGSSKTTTTLEISSIKKLSEASTKHKKSDWLEIENYIQDLDNTEGFNAMLLGSIDKNIANLKSVGIYKEEAYATNSDLIYDDLLSMNLEDLDNQVVVECTNDDKCKEEAYSSLSEHLIIDKEEAYSISIDVRGEEKSLVNDKLVKEFTCESGEVRTVQHYGIEDVFSTSNGIESTNPNPTTAILPNLVAYNNNVNANFVNYDNTHNDRLFLEDIKNLPTDITKGRFYIGLKSNGSSLQVNDTISIGDLTATGALNTQARFSAKLTDLNNTTLNWSDQLVSNTNPTTDIYWNDFSNIIFYNGQTTLLDHVQTNNHFDAYVQDDTSVDFITVATCSKPNPIKEITAIVNKFKCSEKETMVKILGGEIDNFNPTVDTPVANPSPSLIANNTYGNGRSDYDQTNVNKVLLDTLDLSQVSGTVTKAEFHMGYKSLGDPLTGNDTVTIGEYGVEHIGGRYLLYPNGTNPLTPTPWVPNNIAGEQLLSVNLANTTSSITTSLNMLDWIQGRSAFDIRVEDDTSVDFTQLNLCVSQPCGKVYDINLTQASQWSGDNFTELEPSTLPANDHTGRLSWAPSMSWFDFSGNNQNNNTISMEICACDDIELNIGRLKADNSAKVYLDSTLVVDHHGTGQSTFIEDAWQNGSGITGSGSANITIPSGTPQTHTLRIEVHDSGVVTGLAVEGTLNFRGHMGKCK